MDQFLNGLFGSRDEDTDDARRERAENFVNRVERGNVAEEVSTEEVVQNYTSVTAGLSDSEYADAAHEALSRLRPEQRREYRQLLPEQTGDTVRGDSDDSQEIAQLMTQLRSSGAGGGLSGLLGGGGGDDLVNAVSGLVGGGGGPAKKPDVTDTSEIGDLLGEPVVNAVLAGIAAAAMRKYGVGGSASDESGLLEGFASDGDEPDRATTSDDRP